MVLSIIFVSVVDIERLQSLTDAIAHPCNVKDFEIQVGMSQSHLKTILHSQLQNDTKSERFPLPSINSNGNQHPTLFIKIVCIS